MKQSSLILGAGLITAAVVAVVVISSGGGGSNKKAAATSNEVTIGKQVWMTENLNVDTFRNGEPIPEVKTKEEWEKASNNQQPAWCYYNYDPANGKKYGKLYNWYAVNDSSGLAPKGWHVPSDEEWTILTDFLGGDSVAGTKMKSTSGWQENGNGTNESGFSGLPGGFCGINGNFADVGGVGYWWSSSEENTEEYNKDDAWVCLLEFRRGDAERSSPNKGNGFYVRCLRYSSTQVDSTKASFKILGTWVNVDDPTNKVFFTADSFGQISAETLKYNWINEQEMDVTISTDKKARMKITIDGDNLTISNEGDESKYIREGAVGNTATTADNDPIEVTIGTQVWMAQNLNVDKFRNGDSIPEVKTIQEWEEAGYNQQPAWCYYNNDPANGEKYGKLYNWYAVADSRGLAPKGWHVPSDEEWTILTDFLGGEKVAGTKMKSKSGWQEDGNGTNESGFSGLPGGNKDDDGPFDLIGNYGFWWSSSEKKPDEYNLDHAWYRYPFSNDGKLTRKDGNKAFGLSVRCLKN